MAKKHTIPTEAMKFTEARPQLSELLNRVHRLESRILIKKGEIPVAAIVSIQDLERLEEWSAKREENFTIFDEIGAAFADVSDEELEREVNRAVAEARKELRAEQEEREKREPYQLNRVQAANR